MSTISLRLPDSIHQKIKEIAARDGTSINQFVATAAAEKVSALETEQYLEDRARQGRRERFLELLAKAPDIEPDEGDRLPNEPRRVAEGRGDKSKARSAPRRRRKQ